MTISIPMSVCFGYEKPLPLKTVLISRGEAQPRAALINALRHNLNGSIATWVRQDAETAKLLWGYWLQLSRKPVAFSPEPKIANPKDSNVIWFEWCDAPASKTELEQILKCFLTYLGQEYGTGFSEYRVEKQVVFVHTHRDADAATDILLLVPANEHGLKSVAVVRKTGLVGNHSTRFLHATIASNGNVSVFNQHWQPQSYLAVKDLLRKYYA